MLISENSYYTHEQLVHVDGDDAAGTEFRRGDSPDTGPRANVQDRASRSNTFPEGVVEFAIALRVSKKGLVRLQ